MWGLVQRSRTNRSTYPPFGFIARPLALVTTWPWLPLGWQARFPGNKAGAEYGTGYCDAQCPHDVKFINGEANILDWDDKTASAPCHTHARTWT